MSGHFPTIAKADVRRLVTSQSFERGVSYHNNDAIFEPVRQGNQLRAYCAGSGYEPYRVSVTLGPEGIASAYCTCPYDWGGVCKHVVALLVEALHRRPAPAPPSLAGPAR